MKEFDPHLYIEALRNKKEKQHIAIQFPNDTNALGLEALDTVDVYPLNVAPAETGLVYIFSEEHWSEVEETLRTYNVVYQYMKAPSFTPESLAPSELWTQVDPQSTQE